MYFPKLFDLFIDSNNTVYTSDIISAIDDYLGSLHKDESFYEKDLNYYINDLQLTEQILNNLCQIKLIEVEIDEDSVAEDDEFIGNKYVLLVEPKKLEDKSYLEYIKKKRQIDSFSIIYEKTKMKKSGALTLIDLKGYSKNVNNSNTNPAILLLIYKIQSVIDEVIKPYFLNSYSGIEIKHNGDGWFLYFLNENESYEFLEKVINVCLSDSSIKREFDTLGTTLKCYIHHAREIEKIYKVDTLHFDMEGKDVIIIHMLEKPIEKKLYDSIISKSANFIAITENVLTKINEVYRADFKELKNLENEVLDSEGKPKIMLTDLRIFYKAYQ